MSFQLSPEVDKNKIFLVKLSELEGRLDPSSYSIRNIFLDSIFSLEKISDYFFINPQQKSNIKENDTYSFVPMENISKSDATIKNLGIIKGVNTKGYTPFNMGDLIFAKITPCMENGKMAVVKYLPHSMAFGSTEFHVFRSKNKLSVHYLRSLFLIDRFREYAKCNFTGTAGHQRIPPEFFYKLKIPIPPKEIQTQIVAKMDAAYATKKQKEAEAQRLLDGIDGYLLGELGIELPKQAENTLQNRIFIRQLSEVSGGRFDPDYFQEHYRKLQNLLQSGCFECKAISGVTDLVVNGNTPASNDYSDAKTDFPIIKVKSYERDLISLKKLGFTKGKKYQRAKQNDIFVLSAAHQSNYVGRFVKFLDDKPTKNTSFVGELICIRPNAFICDPRYLFSLLNVEACKVLLNREKTGQTSHIYPKDIKHIKIPLPPLEKQTEIANHITAIRNQAKELQKQAKTGLEQAKKAVEAIILGEDESNKQ